jgi:acetyl esterase/lipase
MRFHPWIDPELVPLIDALGPLLGDLTDERLAGVRAERATALTLVRGPDGVERTDYLAPGGGAAPDVAIRVHRPAGASGALPCIYFIHGGGYVLGTHRMEDLRLGWLCQEVGCMATSVTYRLAPETPYPGPLEDCYGGLAWLYRQAGELGIDAARIGIGGASAGGGLAAALALAARDREELPVAFQLLIYPMLDDRAITASSRWEVPVWDPAKNTYAWRAYLGSLSGSAEVPYTAAPSRAPDLAGLPPSYVAVGSADLFVDEDIAYAQALMHAGVPTELHVYAGAVHGFESVAPTASVSLRARSDLSRWLRGVTAPATP